MNNNTHQFSCPIGTTLDIIAGKWKPEILWYLTDKTMRFNQLQRAIGNVSQKMLTQQLRELQRDGLVLRKQYEEIPPKVEYSSTELANTLKPLFGHLTEWGADHLLEINKSRNQYDNKVK